MSVDLHQRRSVCVKYSNNSPLCVLQAEREVLKLSDHLRLKEEALDVTKENLNDVLRKLGEAEKAADESKRSDANTPSDTRRARPRSRVVTPPTPGFTVKSKGMASKRGCVGA